MNNISEQLLQAIDTVTDIKIEKLQFDKTIKASIFGIADVNTGEYKVKYTGNIFSAYTQDGKTYKAGEDVFVKVPEGDFSNKKIIEGRVSETSLSYNEMTGLQNTVESISPPLDSIYKYETNPIEGLIAGSPDEEIDILPERALAADGPDFLFQQYANEYETLRISAEFKTNFYSEHTKGNYGIKITFFTSDDSEISYSLDVESFNGAPYDFTVYTPQSIILKVQKGYLKGVKHIVFFQNNFVYDRFVINGIPGEENTEIPNLFVTNIDIDYVDVKDLTQEPLYLQISTPQGTLLTQQTQNIDLVGKLLANGENVLSTSTCQCTWYKRDLSVIPGNDAYNKIAGVGWREIEGDFNKLSLSITDVSFVNEYKLLIIYNERTPISATVKVTNTLSDYSCSIVQDTEVSAIYLRLDGNKEYSGDWYIQYPDGAYNKIFDKQPKIDITDFLKYTVLTFYCQVFDGDNIIANLSHQIITSENENDLVVTFYGDSSFKYDANGDIAVDDYEKARELYAKLAWKEGMGSSFKIEWRGPDGKVLTNQAYNPSNSMITDLYVDENYNVWYNIARKYNINYNDNILQLVITPIGGQPYVFNKELLFIKDGDQGTNGTTYVIAIRPCDSSNNKLSGFNPLVYNGGWKESQAYYCYVYKDGQQINSSDQFNITYNWTGENLTLTTPTSAMITVAGGSSSSDVVHYLKVAVNIYDNVIGKDADLYAIYPVDVLVGELDKAKVNITSIPQFIKYSSSGRNPIYENNPIEFLYDNSDYSDKIASQNKTVLDIFDKDNGNQKDENGKTKKSYFLKPAISYYGDDEQPMGLLKCEQAEDKYIMHPVIMYLDTFGNEAINGWDGTKLEIDKENEQYIFAPQVGAGEKKNNIFSGVILAKGEYGPYEDGNHWGVYGFQNGKNSFGLDDKGRAWFGQDKGQIKIDGTKATITGGDGGEKGLGMTLIMDPNGDITTKGIELGGGAFSVTYEGKLTATGVKVDGEITAIAGKIAGWDIAGNRLESINNNSIYLDGGAVGDNGTALNINNQFYVMASGRFVATTGSLGGWLITADNEGKGLIMSENGVTSLYAKDGSIATKTFKIQIENNIIGNIGIVTTSTDKDALGINGNDNNVVVNSGQNVKITGQISANVESNGQVTLKGNNITMNSDTKIFNLVSPKGDELENILMVNGSGNGVNITFKDGRSDNFTINGHKPYAYFK